MSALARWFMTQGVKVGGYDLTETPLTQALVGEGMDIHYTDNVEKVSSHFLNKKDTLTIYTPAIPKHHKEFNFFKAEGFTLMKRSEVLGLISKDRYTIAVAGTHGKTTTSSMIAYLLNGTMKRCAAFVGGIMTNFGTNLLNGTKQSPVVVEADEYDKSFMQLYPNYTIVTSLDPDHLDIYGDESCMQDTYKAFVEKTPETGKSLMSSEAVLKIDIDRKYTSYGIKKGDVRANNLRVVNGSFVFDYLAKEEKISDIYLQLPGYHNVENALAAITVALDMGMKGEEICERLQEYAGVKRRFEYIFRNPSVTLIDDYAHHPQEIKALLKSVRTLFRDKKVLAIFQPHLFSRTNDFKQEFANVLNKADEILLLDIYPARELPIEGVTSNTIYELIQNKNKKMIRKEELIQELDNRSIEVVLTIGAGDIDKEVPKIGKFLQKKYAQPNTTKNA